MSRYSKFNIDVDTGHSVDDPRFYSLQLVTYGDNRQHLIDHAWIHYVDQDGGEGPMLELENCPVGVRETCLRIIDRQLSEAGAA